VCLRCHSYVLHYLSMLSIEQLKDTATQVTLLISVACIVLGTIGFLLNLVIFTRPSLRLTPVLCISSQPLASISLSFLSFSHLAFSFALITLIQLYITRLSTKFKCICFQLPQHLLSGLLYSHVLIGFSVVHQTASFVC
jgi:hypothetical protein